MQSTAIRYVPERRTYNTYRQAIRDTNVSTVGKFIHYSNPSFTRNDEDYNQRITRTIPIFRKKPMFRVLNLRRLPRISAQTHTTYFALPLQEETFLPSNARSPNDIQSYNSSDKEREMASTDDSYESSEENSMEENIDKKQKKGVMRTILDAAQDIYFCLAFWFILIAVGCFIVWLIGKIKKRKERREAAKIEKDNEPVAGDSEGKAKETIVDIDAVKETKEVNSDPVAK